MSHAPVPSIGMRVFSFPTCRVVHIPATSQTDWSLKNLYDQSSLDRNWALAQRLAEISHTLNLKTVYAPSVAHMSAHIITDVSKFGIAIRLNSRVTLYRDFLAADGVRLEQDEAFMMSSGGCPIVIASSGEHCIAAHTGLDSLADPARVQSTGSSRTHDSVIEAIADCFLGKGIALSEVSVAAGLAIPQEDFVLHLDQPEFADRTRALQAHITRRWGGSMFTSGIQHHQRVLCVSMEKLIEEQARALGFGSVQIFGTLDTYSAYTRHPDANMRTRRNLAIVLRTA